MLRGTRGRLTIPDVAFMLAAFAIMGILYPIWNKGFVANMGEMNPATAWLFRLMLPLMILVLMSVLWGKSTAGVAR